MVNTIIFFRNGSNDNNYTTESEKTIKGNILPMSINHTITYENDEYLIKTVDWDFDHNNLYVIAYLKN